MNIQKYGLQQRRNTSAGFFNTQKQKEQLKIGLFVPYQERKLVADDINSAHFKLGN
jgi:hypothetical protein